MNEKHWLLGWVLAAVIIGVGIWHLWWNVILLGMVFSGVWWFAPDIWFALFPWQPPEKKE